MNLVFLPADKYKRFIQDDSITLGVRSLACPKYLKQHFKEISQGKHKRWRWFFCEQINLRGFFKLILSFWLCVARHTQNTQNNKFAVSLQYVKKDVSDEDDSLHADNHESLLQIDTMILLEIVRHSQNSQNSKFSIFWQYLKKEVRNEVDFLHAGKRQSFLEFDFNCLSIKVSNKVILSLLIVMIKHSQSTQCKNLALSLQYHKKKKLGMEFIFCMEINIVGIIVFYGSAQTFLKYPKKVGNSFAMYYEESVATAFLFYFDPKHLYILRWSSHVSCYLFLSVTSFSVIATLFDVPSCILKLKDFNCCNSLTPHPFIKLGH